MKNKKKKVLSPREAKTDAQFDKLGRDNIDTKDAWILVDAENVHICNQRDGESSTGEVSLSRKDFEKFIDWYNTGVYKRGR